MLLPLVGNGAEAVKHSLLMYKGGTAGQQAVTHFSPDDRICLYIDFHGIPRGEYFFQADWYNPFGELQDSSSHAFTLKAESDYAVEASLEISRAGFLSRLFSASETTGYHAKFYGEWQVRLFLNGNRVAEKTFEIK